MRTRLFSASRNCSDLPTAELDRRCGPAHEESSAEDRSRREQRQALLRERRVAVAAVVRHVLPLPSVRRLRLLPLARTDLDLREDEPAQRTLEDVELDAAD